MFGFLSPRPHSNQYRQAYARMCVHQRRNFGLRTLPFHSYEAVFLYQLLLDSGAFPASVMPAVRCCKLAQPGNLSSAPDAAHGRFAAAVALLLADIKLQDDIADRNSWLARGLRFVLRGRIRRARLHLATLDPAFESTVSEFLAAHAKLEKRTSPIAIEEYVAPTAEAFGYVFGLSAKLPGLAGQAHAFAEIGRGVGAALIAFDCAVDWQRDRARGEFNPLPDEVAVRAALRFAVHELDEVAVRCRATFGTPAVSAKTAAAVADRLATLQPLARHRCPTMPLWRQALTLFTPKPFLALATGPNAVLEPTEGATPWRSQSDGESSPNPNTTDDAEKTAKKSSSGRSCCNSGNNSNCGNCDCSGLDCNACDCNACDCNGCDCNCG